MLEIFILRQGCYSNPCYNIFLKYDFLIENCLIIVFVEEFTILLLGGGPCGRVLGWITPPHRQGCYRFILFTRRDFRECIVYGWLKKCQEHQPSYSILVNIFRRWVSLQLNDVKFMGDSRALRIFNLVTPLSTESQTHSKVPQSHLAFIVYLI